jgi:hypothetical protein
MSTTTTSTAVLIAEELKQWRIYVDRPGFVQTKRRFEEFPDRNYDLKGLKPRKFLQHEHQTWGINLGWTDNAETATGRKVARWFFTRRSGVSGPVTYGEPLALANGGDPSFLRYKHRDVGINLDWSSEPVFEWKVLGGKSGQPMRTADNVAIYNSKVEGEGSLGECLVYFNRPLGANIGWPSSPSWSDQLPGPLKDLVGDALTAALKTAVLVALGL